jgi:hypothetical protein
MSLECQHNKMTSAYRNIVAELNKSEKLNDENYKIWAMKIQYVLEEQDVLTVLDHILTEPEKYTTLKHISDSAAFESLVTVLHFVEQYEK